MAGITLSDDLMGAITKVVEKGGYQNPDQFIREAIEEKLSLIGKLSLKEEIFKIASEVKGMIEQKGIQEDDILDEFEKFRETLNQ